MARERSRLLEAYHNACVYHITHWRTVDSNLTGAIEKDSSFPSDLYEGAKIVMKVEDTLALIDKLLVESHTVRFKDDLLKIKYSDSSGFWNYY